MAKLSFRIEADWQKVQKLREEISKLKQEIKGTDAIQNPAAFNILNAKLVQTSQELGKVEAKIIHTSVTMETDFKQKIFAASQSVNGFTEEIIKQKKIIADTKDEIRTLSEQYRSMGKYEQSVSPIKTKLKEAKDALAEQQYSLFSLTQEQATARLSVKKLRDEYALFKEEGEGTAQTMDLLTSKMKGIAATIIGGMGLKELASRIISVRAEFESMETSLKVLLGGNQERLNSIMGQIKEYALASPLNTKDMVGAVQMMTSFGIEAEKSIDYLKAIGDISMGNTGKFNSLALAFSQMSSAGKLMGQDLLQMVNAGFNPLEEISRKTGKSIGELKEQMSKGAISSQMVQDAFISATSAGGKFFGMADEGSKTLNGQISMLQESFDMMFNEIGQKSEGVVMTAVQTATKLVENYERTGRVLLGLVTTFGIYRTAVAVATVAQNGHTLAMTLARTRILLTQKAQALLNTTMLANPYVLAATALGVLVGATIMQKTQTDLVNDATKRYNEEKEKEIELEKRHNEEIQKLCDIAGDESLSTENRRLALVKLEQKYPSIFKKYDTEAEKLAHILDIKREIATLDDKNSISNPKNDLQNINKRLAELDKLSKTERLQSSGYMPGVGGGGMMKIAALTSKEKAEQTALLKRKSEITKQISKAASDNYFTNLTGVSNAELDRQIKQRNNLLAHMSLTGKKYGKTTVGGAKGVFSRDELEGQKNILESELNRRNKKATITKKNLQDQKKALQADLDKLSEDEAKGKKGAALKKKIAALTKRENDAYSASTNSNRSSKNSSFDPIKAQNRVEEQKASLSQAEKELENSVAQSSIDAMQKGYEKEKAQRELNHKKELEDIEKHRHDFLQSKQEEAKAAFEADPKNKDKFFNMSSVTLSADEQGKFDEMRANTLKKHANEERDYQIQQIQALNDYLKEYGSFEEKKLAITQEYEEKIRKAGSVGEKASLEMQRDKEIEKAKNDDLQNTIDWNGIFSDLQGHTRQYLQGLRNQLQELLNTGNLPIDQMQVISEKINAIDDELGKQQGIWDYVGEKAREHNRLLKEAADAQERLNTAKANEATAQLGVNAIKSDVQKQLSAAGVDMGIDEISTSSLNGNIDLTDDKFKGMSGTLQKLAVAEGRLADARKKTIKATNEARQAEDKAKINPAQKIADWFSDAQKFIKGKGIDQLPDLLGSVGLSDAGNKIGKGLAGFNSAAGAAADFATGNYIGAAIKAIDAVSNFGSAIFGDGNVDSLEKRIEDLGKSNEILAKSIDSLAQNINKKDATNEQSIDAYKKALAAQKEIEANQREQISARASEWSKKHSFNYYANKKGTDWFGWRDFNKVLSEHGHDKKIMSIDDLWQLSPEMMKLLRDNAYSAWSDLLNNTKGQANPSGLINEYINNAGKKEELTSSLNEKLTGYSWDGFLNSYKSLLKNLESTTEDFADNINEMISNALIESFVNEELQPKIKELYDYISNASKDGLSEDEINEIRKRNDDIAKIGTERRDILEQAGMISQKNASQKASANGVSSITFEQANNIVALTTAGNISRDQIKDLLTAKLSTMDASMRGLHTLAAEHKSIADETRTILANSYLELQGIHEDTTSMNKTLKAMSSDMSDIKQEIRKM